MQMNSNPGSPGYEVILNRQTSRDVPAVTVIVTAYNYDQYLSSCLDSVRQQTQADLDLVVVDDASSDESVAVARDWLESHSRRLARCLLVRQASNGGPGRARNLAFRLARTDYVFVLDADNLIYPRCLERLVECLDNCDAGFTYCYIEKFGGDVGLISPVPWWEPGKFQYGNNIDAMCLFRRSTWAHVGGYSEDRFLDGWEDFELWFRLARQGSWGALVPEILARYRTHGQSLLRRWTNDRVDQLWAYLRTHYSEFFTGDSAPDPLAVVEEMRASLSWRLTRSVRFAERCVRFARLCVGKAPGFLRSINTRIVRQWYGAALSPRASRGGNPRWVARGAVPSPESLPR